MQSLILRLAHSAEIGILKGWVVAVSVIRVPFGSEVEVREPLLMKPFSPDVHPYSYKAVAKYI